MDLVKRLELLKTENEIKYNEISKLTDELNEIHNHKNILLSEMNDKNYLAETLTKEIKRNEEIVNNFNSINKQNSDKDQIIKDLKIKILHMEKNKPNRVYFDFKENE
jgi:ABC-type Zn uptake system ZnuABC Zn-binding protein ZnuA